MAEADPAMLRQPTAAEQRLDAQLEQQRSDGAMTSFPPETAVPGIRIYCFQQQGLTTTILQAPPLEESYAKRGCLHSTGASGAAPQGGRKPADALVGRCHYTSLPRLQKGAGEGAYFTSMTGHCQACHFQAGTNDFVLSW